MSRNGSSGTSPISVVEDPVRFGSLFHQKRQSYSMSQKKLAELSGVTAAAISQIERGKRIPTLPTFCKLSEALGRAPGSLLNEILLGV